jgi:hypothetical protein
MEAAKEMSLIMLTQAIETIMKNLPMWAEGGRIKHM